MAKTAKLDDRRQEKAAAKPEVDSKHNGGVTQELLLSYVADFTRLKKQIDTAKAAYATCRKKAKGDGIVLSDLDYAIGQAEKQPEEIIDAHNTRITYMNWLGIPVAKQFDLVDIMQAPQTSDEIVEKARADGLVAGREGKSQSDNPHDANTPAGQVWLEAWHEGQKSLVPGMQDTAKQPASNSASSAPGAE